MEATTLTTALATHPVHVLFLCVLAVHAVRRALSRPSRRSVRPADARPANRVAA